MVAKLHRNVECHALQQQNVKKHTVGWLCRDRWRRSVGVGPAAADTRRYCLDRGHQEVCRRTQSLEPLDIVATATPNVCCLPATCTSGFAAPAACLSSLIAPAVHNSNELIAIVPNATLRSVPWEEIRRWPPAVYAGASASIWGSEVYATGP